MAGGIQAIPAVVGTQNTYSPVGREAVHNMSSLSQKRVLAQIEGESENGDRQHGGTSTAYRSQMYYLPERRITIVGLGNHSYEIENPEKNSYMRTSIVPNILNAFFNE